MRFSAFAKPRVACAGILSALATQTLLAAAGILVNNSQAIAGNCDNITNSILPGQFNEACGSGNTVGGTFADINNTPTNNNTGLGSENSARNGNSTAVGHNNLATTVNATAIGDRNRAFGRDSTSVGSSNIVGTDALDSGNGQASSAFGNLNVIRTAPVNGGHSTALGSINEVYGSRSTAVGYNNRIGTSFDADRNVYYDKSTAIGYQSWVFGNSSVVIGDTSQAGGRDGQPGSAALIADRAVAIGHSARARVNGTIAIGDQALAGMSELSGNGGISYASFNSIAIGTNARVFGSTSTTGFASVAIGAQSEATGDSSVSLGSGSTDNGQSNVVSVGNATTQRRIINVASGVDPHDAVNVSQLDLATSSLSNQIATLGTSVSNQMNALDSKLTDQMNDIGTKAYAGTAMVAAIAGIPALQGDKFFNLGVGFGNYLGQSGAAVGGNVRLGASTVLKAAVGYANSAATTSVGIGFSF